MPKPIWKRNDISKSEFRLIWFLVDVGAMNHVVAYGWMTKCCQKMGIHRITLNRMIKRLVQKGLLRHVGHGEIELNPDGFDSDLPEDFIKLKEQDHGSVGTSA